MTSDHDVAAKGAALEARSYVEDWEEQERWRRCEEDEARCEDLHQEWEDEPGSHGTVQHEEL